MEARSYQIEAQVERDHWWFEGRRRLLRRLLAPRAPFARALDVGCGTGANAGELARCAEHTIGIDAAAGAIGAAGRRQPHHEVLICGDAFCLPLADQSVDLVAALDLLEHLDDDQAAVGELFRVLQPGGSVIVFVPALPLLWGLQDQVSHHHRRYRRAQLAALIADAGFVVERLTYFNTLLFAPILALRLAMRAWRPRSLENENQIGGPRLNRALGALFRLEGPLLSRLDLPIGVSLACLARRP